MNTTTISVRTYSSPSRRQLYLLLLLTRLVRYIVSHSRITACRQAPFSTIYRTLNFRDQLCGQVLFKTDLSVLEIAGANWLLVMAREFDCERRQSWASHSSNIIFAVLLCTINKSLDCAQSSSSYITVNHQYTRKMKAYSVISVVFVLVLFSALLHLAACQSDAPKCIKECHCTFAEGGALNVNCSRRGLKEVKNIFDVLTELPSSVSL